MPTSKRRKPGSKRSVPSPADTRSSFGRRRRRIRRWVGWTMVVVGGLSFLVGNIGARTGVVALPFDPHHVIAQFGGGLVAIVGLMIATGGS